MSGEYKVKPTSVWIDLVHACLVGKLVLTNRVDLCKRQNNSVYVSYVKKPNKVNLKITLRFIVFFGAVIHGQGHVILFFWPNL